MRIDIVPAGDPLWATALERLPNEVYQRPDYVAFEARRLGGTAQALIALDGDREVLLPHVLRPCDPLFPADTVRADDVTSPHGYAGMLLSEPARDRGFLRIVLKAFSEALRDRGVVSAFFRMNPILNDGLMDLLPPDLVIDLGDCVVVDLGLDEAAVRRAITKKTRQSATRARRHGYGVAFTALSGVLDEVVAIYGETMDRVEAKDAYRFPRSYFEALADRHDVHCAVVRRDHEIAAACLFFEAGGIVQAHLGGTLNTHLHASPFLLALHEAIFWARSRGNRWLHLGGGLGGADDSLLRFKSNFSPLRRRIFALRIVSDPAAYERLVTLRQARRCASDNAAPTAFFPAYRAA